MVFARRLFFASSAKEDRDGSAEHRRRSVVSSIRFLEFASLEFLKGESSMRISFSRSAICALAFFAASSFAGVCSRASAFPLIQNAPKAMESAQGRANLLGEVVAVDAQKKGLTVKTSDGKRITINLDDRTVYKRVPPGETTLEKAADITLGDISVGDRVSARGEITGDSMHGSMLLVMSRKDLTQKKEQDRADWQRRGISGAIVSVNPDAKELVIKSRSREGMNLVLVSAGKNLRVRRYAPGSIKFTDARQSSFEELKVGDLVRALGDRSPDNTAFTAEEIVAGAFRVVGGKITEVNQEKGEVTISDLQTQQPLVVAINGGSMVRRIPPQMLAMMEQSATGGGGRVMMTPDGPRATGQPGGASPNRPPGGGGQRVIMTPDGQRHVIPEGKSPEEVVGQRGGVSPQEMIERLPAITIADLKTGDGIIVLSTKETDSTRAVAIIVAAGVDSFLKRQQEAKATRPDYQLDLALPGLGAP